jgi:molybdopterin molybdotransferase
VRCARKPRAVVLSTGTELRRAGEELGPGQIYESNGTMLAAALAAAGAEVERLEPVADVPDPHREALRRALTADLVVSSGGVSVGPHDLVRSIAAELAVREVFWRAAVRPGKPVFFGVREHTLVFGLPGNPVAALVGFELFVRPGLRALQGALETGPDYLIGRLAGPVRGTPERDCLTRALARANNGTVVVEPLPGIESHMIVKEATANALVLVPRGEDELPAGAEVRYLPL